VGALYINQPTTTLAGRGFRQDLASESVSDGVFVNVGWEDGAFGVVDVVDPLVVVLRVSDFIYAFDVVYDFLFLLLVVEKSGTGVVCELA